MRKKWAEMNRHSIFSPNKHGERHTWDLERFKQCFLFDSTLLPPRKKTRRKQEGRGEKEGRKGGRREGGRKKEKKGRKV